MTTTGCQLTGWIIFFSFAFVPVIIGGLLVMMLYVMAIDIVDFETFGLATNLDTFQLGSIVLFVLLVYWFGIDMLYKRIKKNMNAEDKLQLNVLSWLGTFIIMVMLSILSHERAGSVKYIKYVKY